MDFIVKLIAKPFGYVLQFCAKLCFNNYALALLLFALIVKVVLLPFGIKQQSTQIKMAKLRPKVAAIEKKYAGRTDRPTLQKKQMEIMELQQKEGVSSFGGCLPLLIQFPILIGLYNVVRNPLSYMLHLSDSTIGKIAEKISYSGIKNWDKFTTDGIINYSKAGAGINQLNLIPEIEKSGADLGGLIDKGDIPDFSLFGLNLSSSPSDKFGWLILIPIFAAVLSYFSMRITRKLSGQAQMMGNADAQKSTLIMDLIMPLISFWISYTYTAALGLYWGFQSIFGLLQSLILAKAMPLPKFSPEEMKRAEKEMKVEEERKKPVKIRSLHHIDDDEDEPTPPPSAVAAPETQDDEDGANAAKDENTGAIAPAPLKDDGDRPSKKKKS